MCVPEIAAAASMPRRSLLVGPVHLHPARGSSGPSNPAQRLRGWPQRTGTVCDVGLAQPRCDGGDPYMHVMSALLNLDEGGPGYVYMHVASVRVRMYMCVLHGPAHPAGNGMWVVFQWLHGRCSVTSWCLAGPWVIGACQHVPAHRLPFSPANHHQAGSHKHKHAPYVYIAPCDNPP